jgi:NTP pyrophosphatase (non-canonical NTP hydrolase)
MDIQSLIKEIIKFRDERDWKQFHNSKDLAIALQLEASELLELFLWKGNEEVEVHNLEEELADVFMYGLLLAEKHQLDFETIIRKKLAKNSLKYPVDKAKGTAKKYNEL